MQVRKLRVQHILLHHVFGEVDGEKDVGTCGWRYGSITQLMRRACEEKGVEISTNAPVKKFSLRTIEHMGLCLRMIHKYFLIKLYQTSVKTAIQKTS